MSQIKSKKTREEKEKETKFLDGLLKELKIKHLNEKINELEMLKKRIEILEKEIGEYTRS